MKWSERQLEQGAIPLDGAEMSETKQGATQEVIAPKRLQLDEAIEETVAGTQEALTPTGATTSEHAIEALEASQKSGSEAVGSSGARLSSPLERKIDALIDMMGQFVQVQLQTQVIRPSPTGATDGELKKQRSRRATRGDRSSEMIGVNDDLPQQFSARAGRKRGEDDAIIERAISAIMAYNDQPGRTYDEKWLVTVSLLKKFTPNHNQRAAQRVLDERKVEIIQHHQKHQLQPDHNNRHKKHNVTATVQI
jgi:hypothetical protein